MNSIDPVGMTVTPTGNFIDEYIQDLQKNVSYKINKGKDGKIQILNSEGNAMSSDELNNLKTALEKKGKAGKGELGLFTAITDTEHNATIDTGTSSTPNSGVFFGKYEGNGKNTLDFFDIRQLDKKENAGGYSAAQAVGHETMEAYASSLGKKDEDAHNYANKYFGGLEGPTGTEAIKDPNTGLYNVIAMEFKITGNNSFRQRVGVKLVTPEPTEEAAGKGVKNSDVIAVKAMPIKKK